MARNPLVGAVAFSAFGAVGNHASACEAAPEADRLNPNPRPGGLIETESFWINVNESGMPARISDGGFEYLSSMTSEHRLRWKQMNSSASPDLHTSGTADDRPHILRTKDFDPLKRMNNSTFWAVIEDELIEHPDLTNGPPHPAS